jgi:hypothetical protein
LAEAGSVAAGGAPAIRRRPPGAGLHHVNLYEDERLLAVTVSEFLGQGLLDGEPAIVIATPAHAVSFCERLGERGFDVERLRADGRLVLLDARESLERFMVDGVPDWELFRTHFEAVIDRSFAPRARAFGEMVDLLWRDGNRAAALQLEGFWNQLGQTHSFSLLCAYVLGNFYKETDRVLLRDICGTHDAVEVGGLDTLLERVEAPLRELLVLRERVRELEAEVEHRRELEKALRTAVDELAAVIGERR